MLARPFIPWLLALVLAGCGERKASPQRQGKAPPEVADQLVALRIREVRSSDRQSLAGDPPVTTVAYEAPREREEIAHELARVDPGADWHSEQLSSVATRQLRRLLAEGPAQVIAPGAWCTDLRPQGDLSEQRLGRVVVRRWTRGSEGEARHEAAAGVEEAVAKLRRSFDGAERDFSIKPVAIDVSGAEFAMRIHLEMRGFADGTAIRMQVNADWESVWTDTDPPRMRSLALQSYEEILFTDSGPPLFVDATRNILGHTPHFQSQVRTGIEDWASHLTRLGDFSFTGHHGLAVGDVNGDGREDLFVCDAGSLPNRLYLQQPDGSVRDVSAAAGVDWFEDSRSALLVDLDNDGDQDLVVATIAMIAFAENDGTGVFTLRGGFPEARYPFSLSAADFDNDGNLDIYACVYSAGDSAAGRGFEATSPAPFHDAENGGRNVLLRNLGKFQFADVTAPTGLDRDNTRWSFAAAWEDFDRDGDPDLYVANDFGRNCFYRNDDGSFTQIAGPAGVEDTASGMSVAWGDYNGDGTADLYVGNMYSAAGKRVSFQQNFIANASEEVVFGLQRMSRGNSLFESDGQGRFVDRSESAGAHYGGWAWSSGFADVNNDGWEDLAIANGYLTGARQDDL